MHEEEEGYAQSSDVDVDGAEYDDTAAEESQWEDYETALSHQQRGQVPKQKERLYQQPQQPGPLKRSAKRSLGSEYYSTAPGRDKRARKVPGSSASATSLYNGDGMDVEEDDAGVVGRGKKRDRAEAGSTFGGGDYEEEFDDDNEHGDVGYVNGRNADEIVEERRRSRKQRKRRTVGSRRPSSSDLVAFGNGTAAGRLTRKRDREEEEEDGEGDWEVDEDEGEDQWNVNSFKKQLKKKARLRGTGRRGRGGRRGSSVEDDVGSLDGSGSLTAGSSTYSVRGSGAAEDGVVKSKVKGRRVGEVWESGNVVYKIGSGGERLRQALVKRERNKFAMVCDSLSFDYSECEANVNRTIFSQRILTIPIRTRI